MNNPNTRQTMRLIYESAEYLRERANRIEQWALDQEEEFGTDFDSAAAVCQMTDRILFVIKDIEQTRVPTVRELAQQIKRLNEV